MCVCVYGFAFLENNAKTRGNNRHATIVMIYSIKYYLLNQSRHRILVYHTVI